MSFFLLIHECLLKSITFASHSAASRMTSIRPAQIEVILSEPSKPNGFGRWQTPPLLCTGKAGSDAMFSIRTVYRPVLRPTQNAFAFSKRH